MKIRRYISIIIISSFLVVPFVSRGTAFAATSDIAAARQELEQQLQEIEQQIAQYQKQLVSIKGQKNTLTKKIAQLRSQQAALQLQIQATNLRLGLVKDQIDTTQSEISQLNIKIQLLQSELAEIIHQLNDMDRNSFLYVLVMSGNLSNLFDQIQNYQQLIGSLSSTFEQLQSNRKELEQQSQALNAESDQLQNLVVLKVLQQKQLSGSVAEQNELLKQTKGNEQSYQNILKASQSQAAAIKSRIYQLFNVGKQITFGQAVEIASWVSSQTNVPTALLLAVLTQESNLGQNVGTCNRAGDPPEKSWKVIMKPTRDQQPFLAITKELGLDPDTTPVSCPMHDSDGSQIGWGGAMGPAQFIPSTWAAHENQVSAITGKSPASPWDIRDAFVASAILLKANGANSTQQGQWNAAMRYFSGSTDPQYSFYGDNVLALAEKYQADIDQLNK